MSTIININPLLKNEHIESNTSFDYKYTTDVPSMEGIFAELPVGILSLEAAGEIKIHDGVMKNFFNVDCKYKTRCARCDRELIHSVKINDSKVITLKEDEENGYETDSFPAEDGLFNLDDFLLEFITLALPNKELCAEDCKGLCLVCGADLNVEQCGCKNKKGNPGFNVLDDFFKE